MKKIFSSIMTLAVDLAFTACGGNSNDGGRKAQELSGAGATFPLPFYNVVFENFAQVNGDAVAYGGIGSGGGVRNLRDKIVDFAGSDAFLSDKEMAEMNPVIHVPTCMGAVVLAYNLDGISELKLSKSTDLYARFDDLYSKNDWNKAKDESVTIIGAQFKVGKYVKIAPNFRMNMPKCDGTENGYSAYINCYFGFLL